MKSANGTSEILTTAFTHVKDAWHDMGVHFSNLSLPFSSHVNIKFIHFIALLISILMSSGNFESL